MKTLAEISRASLTLLSWVVLIGEVGCSSGPKHSERAQFTPPVIVNPRAEPQVAVLNQNFKTLRPLDVYADVKNFGSDLDKVKLRLTFAPDTEERMKFFRRPVDLEMQNIGGTTWKAHLSNRELQKLAINGESLKYSGVIVAKNSQGQVSISGEPVEITVEAPQHIESTG